MNKILARSAAVLAALAISSFAAWDYFPVPDKDNVQLKVGGSIDNQGTRNEGGSFVQGRFVPIQGLEGSIYYDGGYTLGLRYQFISVVNAFVDVTFPMGQENWSFHPGVQFSTAFNDKLSLGAQVGIAINTEDNTKSADGMVLDAGVELDYVAGKMFTPYVGFNFATKLSKNTVNGEEDKADETGMTYAPYIGVGINATSNLSLGTSAAFTFGDEAMLGSKDMLTTVGFDATVSF